MDLISVLALGAFIGAVNAYRVYCEETENQGN